MNPIHLGLVAGEASGDFLGAGLIQALRELHPSLRVSGIGGSAMIQAGCHSLYPQEDLAVMGLIEPLKRLPRLLEIRRGLYRHFTSDKPQLFVGIDSPDFNIGLELKLRKQGIRTAHYVSPSVWAWRQYRIHKIAKAVDLMLTLLPFEAAFYEKHHVPVEFVGHPLASKIPLEIDQAAARTTLGLPENPKLIALLPGSRHQELQYLGKAFLEAATLCHKAKPELRFITSSINAERDREWRDLHQAIAPQLPLNFYIKQTHEVMAAADAVLVTSGTATLETMLFKKPMVIAYRTSGFNYLIGRLLIKTPFIGLPNLLAQRPLVPELIQDAVKPETLSQLLLDYLDHPAKIQGLQDKFTLIHQQLAKKADQQAAKALSSLILA